MEVCIQSSESLSKTRTSCCKLKYRPRSFSSKGAKLILLWNFLTTMALFNLIAAENHTVLTVNAFGLSITIAMLVVAITVWFLSTILSGWLADVRLGRYKVIKASLVLIWLTTIVNTIRIILTPFLMIPQAVELTCIFTELVIGITGIAAFYVNGVQFGLDQMPDASSEQITSFIAWNVTLQAIGVACGYIIYTLQICATHPLEHVGSILSVAILSLILCMDYLLGNWLINLKQAVNPFVTVCQVLGYAAKHKSPENRSAFTYCEDRIPSRIDNGKSKYGGPFTTEQVENVKTFLRILVMLSTCLGFVLITMFLIQAINITQSGTALCSVSAFLQYFIPALITIIMYELLLYPLLKNWIPNMMKRIAICMFVNMLLSFMILLTLIIRLYSSLAISQIELKTVRTFGTNIYILGLYIFITSVLEFMYAQSPENMKGFLSACIISVSVLTSSGLSSTSWYQSCTSRHCKVTFSSLVTALSIAAFFLYTLAARWYKKREREEVDNTRAIIEEIYSRNLEQDQSSD